MENWQSLINLFGGAALAAIGWFCRQVWEAVQRLQEDVHKIEVDLPRNYVRQDQIDSKLDKIDARFDKLDAHITRLFEIFERRNGLVRRSTDVE